IMYGSLSTLILVMVWLYFCMNLLLYGAEINAYFESQFRQAKLSFWQLIARKRREWKLERKKEIDRN
ncbi:MAG: YhjD/YihY/BrkB family envelope integrity protein, partial [Blautia caecimuris]